ncbi:hypothetical protein M434DRAFT_393285 [Hypoxylon sp. CO27-5]|nr:hypothetical protein M434DRAFT_393285 [Hypoxylon sp. CO27-5]
MDPGTIVGVVSLAFQIFSGCVKGCQLLLEARDFPKNYAYLRHRLLLEQFRLLDWWGASDFTLETTFEDTSTTERRQLMIDTMCQIRSLTLNIDHIKNRYGLTLKTTNNTGRDDALTPTGLATFGPAERPSKRETLRQACLQFADKCLECPMRLRWATFDATKFEQLLARFSDLNNLMHSNLEFAQRCQYIQVQEDMYIRVLQSCHKLDQVIELIQSLRLPTDHIPGGSSWGSNDNTFSALGGLARFMALNMTVGEEAFSHDKDTVARMALEAPSRESVELAVLELNTQAKENEKDIQRAAGTYNSTAVWVEWKYYDNFNATLTLDYVKDRIARLAVLLHKKSEKPQELRLPAALGYVHDPSSRRFGLVFESLALTRVSLPQSLYARLQTSMKPSLTMRLAMAQRLVVSLAYLHATKWLHKGLRSDNILFLTPSASDWQPFCLSGFDYSRPGGEMTELPTNDRKHDLYRHPDVQFDVPRDGEYGYKEMHDIYSLGVVLMEIGLWQPIHQFLGVSLNQLIPRPTIRGIRKSLLKAESLAILQSEAGERFSEVVRLCLAVGLSLNELGSFGVIREDVVLPENSTACLQRAQQILQSIIL